MGTEETVLNITFYALAALAGLGALGVAASRNIVRSCFLLLAVLTGVAGLYLVAWADFLFAVQVLVYIGGVLVLVIFAVMLTHRITNVRLSNESQHSFGAFVAAALLFGALVTVIVRTPWPGARAYRDAYDKAWTKGMPDYYPPRIAMDTALEKPAERPGGITEELGRALRDEQVLPLEFVGVLLLVAIVGASFLARKEVRGP